MATYFPLVKAFDVTNESRNPTQCLPSSHSHHACIFLLETRQVYPALMNAAMSEPLNATDVAASVSSVRELVGVRPNSRL